MLTLANLSYNEIESLENLDNHIFLECLLLNHNRIQSIVGLKDLRLLQVSITQRTSASASASALWLELSCYIYTVYIYVCGYMLCVLI